MPPQEDMLQWSEADIPDKPAESKLVEIVEDARDTLVLYRELQHMSVAVYIPGVEDSV